jgi:mycofactocin precursor
MATSETDADPTGPEVDPDNAEDDDPGADPGDAEDDDPEIEEDLIQEELRIDGICGVY